MDSCYSGSFVEQIVGKSMDEFSENHVTIQTSCQSEQVSFGRCFIPAFLELQKAANDPDDFNANLTSWIENNNIDDNAVKTFEENNSTPMLYSTTGEASHLKIINVASATHELVLFASTECYMYVLSLITPQTKFIARYGDVIKDTKEILSKDVADKLKKGDRSNVVVAFNVGSCGDCSLVIGNDGSLLIDGGYASKLKDTLNTIIDKNSNCFRYVPLLSHIWMMII
jgi:hypothetical protein